MVSVLKIGRHGSDQSVFLISVLNCFCGNHSYLNVLPVNCWFMVTITMHHYCMYFLASDVGIRVKDSISISI